MVPLRSGFTAFALVSSASLTAVLALHANSQGPSRPATASHPAPRATAPRMPLLFEANRGQAEAGAEFLARTDGGTLRLKPSGTEIDLRDRRSGTSARVRMQLRGARPQARLRPEAPTPTRLAYYLGNDPSRWVSNVATHAKVRSEGVYAGIDLVYYASRPAEGEALEYDFQVAPGADPSQIALDVSGANRVSKDAAGNLHLQTAAGELQQHRPVAYQVADGQRRPVTAEYQLQTDPQQTTVRFALGDYDPQLPLVIDPALTFSSYYGGNGDEYASSTAVDSSGNIWVTGRTTSANLTTTSAAVGVRGGDSDAFLAKFDPTGAQLLFAAYVGGADRESINAITIDSLGRVCIAGSTASTDYPLLNPYRSTAGGASDVCVSRFTAAGVLQYSTLLPANGDDHANAIDTDTAGNLYVCGVTNGSNFLVANALQATRKGAADCFVSCIAEAGSSLVYSTYLGGTGNLIERANGIVVDAAGNAFVTGNTPAADFPLVNAVQTTYGGTAGGFSGDAFVCKIAAGGGSLLYSTYLGGSGDEAGVSIDIDAAGQACVTGTTSSANFPLAQPLSGTLQGDDAFVTKLNNNGSAFVYSTYLGGAATDNAFTVRQDSLGYAYVGGFTNSGSFPVADALFAAPIDFVVKGFVTRIDPDGSAIGFSTCIGGNGGSQVRGIALEEGGSGQANRITLVGGTVSTNFPTVNPVQAAFGGGTAFLAGDAFVSRIEFGIPQAPSALAATLVNPTRIILTWTDTSSDETGFLLERKTGSGSYSLLGTLAANTTSFTDSTVVANTAYTYRVTATNAFGNSPASSELTVTIPVGGKLKIAPKSVNFGTVKVNGLKTKTFKLTNAGKGALAGTIGSAGTPFTVISGGGAFVLAPKGKRTVTVRFQPSSAGAVALSIPVTSTDPKQTAVSVAVKGKGK